MKINCIIVEDEPLAMERTVGYVNKIAVLQLTETFDNALDAFSYLKKNTIDLIFLDINLGKLSGIQLLESMNIKSDVIITTAYPDYALKGYDLNVTDYLLKPFSFERFLQAVDKVKQAFALQEAPTNEDFFFVKTARRLEKIFFADVLYIEGMRDYRKIHASQKNIMTLQTFNWFEKNIPPHLICRVHKSYMVAISKIETVEKDCIHIQNKSIPISETYKELFFKLIGQ